jgi:hypothetical protein
LALTRQIKKTYQIKIMKHIIKLKTEKDTPGTIKFAEVAAPGNPPVIKHAYFQKWAVSRGAKHSMVFTKEKDTPGTRRFTEVTPPQTAPVMKSLYVQLWAATSDNITATVEFSGDGTGATLTIEAAK